jgi:hypothetical protein
VGATRITRIISGGQTGVDRAALDVAIARGIPHGGFCPKGRRAEDGRIPGKYQLEECHSPEYPVRTALNVQNSDGTLIITRGEPDGGTKLTIDLCAQHQKPHFIVDVNRTLDIDAFGAWNRANKIAVLNVAGPRESKQPGIGNEAKKAIAALLSR